MAQSANYYGLRRGSTKSHTYSVVEGKQITKDRVEGGKNPRTLAQMSQRCLLSTCGAAYSAMKCICNHSFEDKTSGMQCMREFMSANLKEIKLSKELGHDFFGFNNYKQSGLVPGSYIISDGSLPNALVDAQVDSVDATNKKVTLALTTAANGTIGEVAGAMGCRLFGDMCTVAVMYPKTDGSYGFGAVRFTYKSGATVLESFGVAVVGDTIAAAPTFTADTLKVEVRMSQHLATNATAANTYMAAITSRKLNGVWRRSHAQFSVTSPAPAFAQAIATYPIGHEYFLNGGDENIQATPVSQGDSGSGTSPDPSQGGSGSQSETVAAPTISGNTSFAESTQVSMSGPDGAEIRYTTDGSVPTAESTLYSAPFSLTATTVVKAIAIKNGVSSEVTAKTFTKSSGAGDDAE